MIQSNYSSSTSVRDLPSLNTLRSVYVDKQAGEFFEFGRYPQGVDGDVKPITWRVLRRDKDHLLVIAEQGLDCKPYNEERCKIAWADSTLCRWLNSEFYDKAFNEQERECILKTSVVNKAGHKTEGHIFLLSIDEAISLFANEIERRAKSTEYAVKNGAYTYDDCCCWWLRSRGIGGDNAACVAPDGLIGDLGLGVSSDNVAVRPALSVNISPTVANSVAKLNASRNYVLYFAVLVLVAAIFYFGTIMTKDPGLGVPSLEPTGTPAVAQSVASSPELTGTPAVAQSAASSPEPMGTPTVAQSADSTVPSLRTIYAHKQVGGYFEFGRYPQGVNGEIEPITWQVLQREKDHLLIIAKHGLECQPYNIEFVSIDWENCTLRRWLNSEFYNTAFNEQECECILKTSIVNNAGPQTEDRIFLLSIDEAKSLFANGIVRRAKPTDYAVKNKTYYAYDNGCCWWWLRSRGNGVDNAAYVRPDGYIYSCGCRVYQDVIAVRPAFKIAL